MTRILTLRSRNALLLGVVLVSMTACVGDVQLVVKGVIHEPLADWSAAAVVSLE